MPNLGRFVREKLPNPLLHSLLTWSLVVVGNAHFYLVRALVHYKHLFGFLQGLLIVSRVTFSCNFLSYPPHVCISWKLPQALASWDIPSLVAYAYHLTCLPDENTRLTAHWRLFRSLVVILMLLDPYNTPGVLRVRC